MDNKTPDSAAKIRAYLGRYRPSAFLLAAQLLLLVLYAVFDGLPGQRALLSAFGGLILILVIWVVNRSPALDWVAWMLAIPAFILSILSAITLNQTLLAWSALLEAILYFYAAGSLIIYMLGDSLVTSDELFAAGATFTLMAWGFAYLNFVCQSWVPDSFINGGHPGQPLTFVELLFLSFTNLSATGLGDVLPISAPARVLAMLEQFCGVGYVAIVVSRLIGMTVNNLQKNKI